MLVPAITWKEEIEKEAAKLLYTESYFYYMGYRGGNELINIACRDNVYQYAILGSEHTAETGRGCKLEGKDKLIGYLTYRYYPDSDTVESFGLISFDPGNPLLGKEVHTKLRELCRDHHRVTWRCVGGNPALRGYFNFLGEMDEAGYKVKSFEMSDVTKDLQGKYRGEIYFEIINPNK